MDKTTSDFYDLSSDQRLDIIALLLNRVDELTAWIEPDEKTAFVLEIIMMHVQSARTLATSSQFVEPVSETCVSNTLRQNC